VSEASFVVTMPTEAPHESVSLRIPLHCICGRSFTLMIVPDGAEPPQTSGYSPNAGCGGGTPLTAHETDVLQRAAHGATDQEISRQLGVSISSIRYAIRDAIARLAARNRTEAVFRAVSAGVIRPDWASTG
jgi:DNA-binding CsgD family transcriptional regulator